MPSAPSAAQSSSEASRAEERGFQHAALDQLPRGKLCLCLGDDLLGNAALADHQGRFQCICLRAQLGALFTRQHPIAPF